MTSLIRAELLKLRTTRMFYGNALAVLLIVPISLAASILTAGDADSSPPLDTSEGLRNVMSASASGAVVVLIIGILLMAGEFRHNTVTSTFLVTPDRQRVVGAKLIAGSIVGAGLAVVASALTLAIAVPWLAAEDVSVDIFSSDIVTVLLGALVATTLYAVVGVGLGSLIRNQTVAVVVALVWVMIVEGLVVTLLPSVGRWMPGGAVAAVTRVTTENGGLLPMWGGGLLFAAYGLAFATAGSRLVLQRDIT